MSYFKVMLAGQGISVPSEDGDPVIGFYVTRTVWANDSTQATVAAKKLVLQEWLTGNYASSNKGGAPILTLDKAWEVGFFSGLFSKQVGYCFYSNNE